MGKKDKVKMRCKICAKKTMHELRIIDGQETYVCLLCEAGSDDDKKEYDSYEQANKIAEKMRLWSNMPRGF